MHIVEYARGYEVLYIERPDHWFLLLFMYIIRFFLSHRRVHVCNNREKKKFLKILTLIAAFAIYQLATLAVVLCC